MRRSGFIAWSRVPISRCEISSLNRFKSSLLWSYPTSWHWQWNSFVLFPRVYRVYLLMLAVSAVDLFYTWRHPGWEVSLLSRRLDVLVRTLKITARILMRSINVLKVRKAHLGLIYEEVRFCKRLHFWSRLNSVGVTWIKIWRFCNDHSLFVLRHKSLFVFFELIVETILDQYQLFANFLHLLVKSSIINALFNLESAWRMTGEHLATLEKYWRRLASGVTPLLLLQFLHKFTMFSLDFNQIFKFSTGDIQIIRSFLDLVSDHNSFSDSVWFCNIRHRCVRLTKISLCISDYWWTHLITHHILVSVLPLLRIELLRR